VLASAAQTGARCAVHVDIAAIDTCSRCGNYVCAGCMEIHNYETICGTCAERVGAKGEQSSRATTALVFGLLPIMTFCLPLGIVAIVLGHMEIAAIDAGEAPASGRNLAKGAVILGWVNVALMIIGVLVVIAIFAAA